MRTTVASIGIRLLAGLLCLALPLVAEPAPAAAAGLTSIIVEQATGEIVSQNGADQPNYPASLTKMMTLLLTFEALRTNRLELDTPLRVSARAASMPPSKLGVRPGATIRVEEAIRALAIKSANDVAVVLAEHLAGSETRFAQLMTRKAQQIGMYHTIFRNASGLPDRQQRTTARDIARLAVHLIRGYPEYYRYFSEGSFQFRGRSYRNHNGLMAAYPGMDGLKTGYIHDSGYNLAASAIRQGRRLVGVVLGGRTSGQRNMEMARLLNEGFTLVAVRQRPVEVAGRRPLLTDPVPAGTAAVDLAALADEAEDDDEVTALGPVAAPTTVRPTVREAAVDAARLRRSGTRSEIGSRPGRSKADAYGIQLGAFGDRVAARQRAKQVTAKIGRAAAGAEITIVRSTKRRGLFMARLVGLTRAEAESSCRTLKRQRQACMVFRDAAVQLAQN